MNYSEQVQDHFIHPRNMGELENPDGRGRAGNPVCGDVMLITLKVKDGKISDIKFKTFGCAAAVATASVITELAKGKSLDEALKISWDDVLKELGELPQQKVHCTNLAVETLQLAIKNAKGEGDGKEVCESCSKKCPKCPKK